MEDHLPMQRVEIVCSFQAGVIGKILKDCHSELNICLKDPGDFEEKPFNFQCYIIQLEIKTKSDIRQIENADDIPHTFHYPFDFILLIHKGAKETKIASMGILVGAGTQWQPELLMAESD